MKDKKIASFLIEITGMLSRGLITVVFVFLFCFSVVTVTGNSMENTLSENDMLFVSGLFYKPQLGDIVVISKNYNANTTKISIKRIVATEGDSVDFKDGFLYVGGYKINEIYAKNKTDLKNIKNPLKFPLKVPAGMVFVLGDNRENSHDSRSADFDLVDIRYILGKAYVRLYPFMKYGDFE